MFISLPLTGISAWRRPVLTIGDLPATGNTVGDVIQVIANETLYTWNGTSWDAISGGGSGAVDSVNGLTGVVTLTTDDIPEGASNYYTAPGGPNIFAYYDNTNHVVQLPNWNVDVVTTPNRYGLRYAATIDPAGVSGYSVTNQIFTNISPTVNAPNDAEVLLQLAIELDPANSGFGFGTSGLASRALDHFVNAQTSAAFGDVNFANSSIVLGDDVITGGEARNVTHIDLYTQLKQGFTATGVLRGINYNTNLDAGSDAQQGLYAFTSSPNIAGNFSTNLIHYTAGGTFAPTNDPGGSVFGFQFSPQITATQQNPVAFVDSSNFLATSDITGDYRSIAINPQFQAGATVRSFTGINVAPTIVDTITNDARGMGIFMQNTVANDGITGLDISLADTSGSSVTGIGINLGNAVSTTDPTGPVGVSSDARLSFNVSRPVINGGTVQIINRLQGMFTIADGSPVTGTDLLANNLAGDFLIQDDLPLGPVGIGANSVGFIASMAVAATKTVDSMTVFLPAAAFPDPGFTTGGNITEFQHIRVFPPLPQGGTANITNLYAYKIDSAFGDYASSATNAWGLYFDTVAENYIGGSLNIGAASKKVANADVALEVGSLKAILLARLTTTQKNALTPVAGMVVYDTTLNQMSYYNGTTWVNV